MFLYVEKLVAIREICLTVAMFRDIRMVDEVRCIIL